MTIEEFYNEAMKNESLMREIGKAGDENRLARLLQERQVDGTEQQFLDFVKEKRRESHELSMKIWKMLRVENQRPAMTI